MSNTTCTRFIRLSPSWTLKVQQVHNHINTRIPNQPPRYTNSTRPTIKINQLLQPFHIHLHPTPIHTPPPPLAPPPALPSPPCLQQERQMSETAHFFSHATISSLPCAIRSLRPTMVWEAGMQILCPLTSPVCSDPWPLPWIISQGLTDM